MTNKALLQVVGLLSVFIYGTLAYDLVREYSGQSFFDRWNYYGLYDNLTLGDVNWVDKDTATTNGLTYVSGQNTAVIRVDNFTTVPFNQKRNSVRITTTDFYALGSLWLFDAVHLPFGCSVWPAWWTKGPTWPDNGGEIDIIENINLAQKNQMAAHSTFGCFHTAAPNQPGISGVNKDCSLGSGCVVGDPDPRSWGKGFADAGGGVWATQFDIQGIFIWFWSRADLPENLLPSAPSDPLDISTWGPPTASFLATTCNISQFFTPQQLIIDITLCLSIFRLLVLLQSFTDMPTTDPQGDWAGVPSIYNNTCASQAPNDPTNPVSSKVPHTPSCYADNVVGPGAHFDNAYFEINHIRAYTTAATPVPTPTAAAVVASTTSGPSNAQGAAGNRAPANSSGPDRIPTLAFAGAALSAFFGAFLILWS